MPQMCQVCCDRQCACERQSACMYVSMHLCLYMCYSCECTCTVCVSSGANGSLPILTSHLWSWEAGGICLGDSRRGQGQFWQNVNFETKDMKV